MQFNSTRGKGLQRKLEEAAVWGYPGADGLYTLAGEVDLRNEIYAPEASFPEIAASFMSALFPENIDPRMAQRLAELSFGPAPLIHDAGSGILVMDLATGPSASAADYEAAFLAGLLAEHKARGERLVLVALGHGSEAAALAEATAGIPGIELVILGARDPIRGLKPSRLRREGGHVSILSLRSGAAAAQALLRSVSGRRLGSLPLIPAGPANPARLAARTVLQIASFVQCRRGVAGDILYALPADDGFALAAGLWAWNLGLPMTGFVLPIAAGKARTDEGRELVETFDRERPGLLRSIVVYKSADEELGAAKALVEAGAPALDAASLRGLAAALSLSLGLKGHGRIIVPRPAHPCWDEAGAPGRCLLPEGLSSALTDARPDAEIGGSLEELESVLARLLDIRTA